MTNANLREILEQMKGKKIGSKYEGPLPNGIIEIRRVASRNFDYTEVILKDMEEKLIRQIVDKAGLNYEKKKRTVDFACEMCPMKQICAADGEPPNAYTITKSRKFWFSDVIADIVNNSIRFYDTKKGIEIGAEILNQYLEKKR